MWSTPLSQGKDVFEAFYKKDLAKRLLLGRSASNDAEKVRTLWKCITTLHTEQVLIRMQELVTAQDARVIAHSKPRHT